MRINQTILVPLGVLNTLIFGLSIFQAVMSGWELTWVGTSIAAGAFFVYTVLSVFLPATRRTSARIYWAQIPSLIGLIVAAFSTFLSPNVHSRTTYWPLALAVAGFAIIFWYTWLYGNYDRMVNPDLKAGSRLPELTFESLDGEQITSESFVDSKTLIVFFRANWCTLCMGQLKEIRARADRLASANVRVKFVSNQPVTRSTELARKLDLPLHFEILYDRALSAARALKIVDVGGTPAAMVGFPKDTVMATVIGLDEDNRVLYLNEPKHYRNRPHPDTFLHVFDGQYVSTGDDGPLGTNGPNAVEEPVCSLDFPVEPKTRNQPNADVCEDC